MNQAKPMTAEELQAIKDRWADKPKLHCDGWSVVDEKGNIICTGSHWGNSLATVVIKKYAQSFAKAPSDISTMVAEVERLNRENEKLKKLQSCRNCANTVLQEHGTIFENFYWACVFDGKDIEDKKDKCDKWEAADNG